MKENQSTVIKLQRPNQPGFFMKRIGNTTYRVGVHFSDTSGETAREKISRLIRNESTAKGIGKAVNQ